MGEGGEHEVEPAVAVVVAGIDTHAGLRPALAVHRDAGQQPDALEAPASQVVVQEVRIRVVRHEEIDLAVAVVVGRDDAEAVGLRRVREAGGRGSLDEGAVPPIQEEEVLLARQARRADHDVGPVAPDQRPLRADDLVPAGLDVARDVEVEIAVGVGVEERAARAPAGGRHAGRRSHVLEGAVALVAKEEVGAPVRDVEVERAVAVVVARADAVAPCGRVEARLLRDILELQPAQVPVEDVAVRHALAALRELRGRHEIDVEPPVAVVVEEGDTTASRLEDVVFGRSSAVRLRREPARLLEERGRGSRRRVVGRWHGRRPHRGGVAAVDRLLHLRLAVAALQAQAERDLALELHPHAFEQREVGSGVEARSARGRGREILRRTPQLGPQLGGERRACAARFGLAAQSRKPFGGLLAGAKGVLAGHVRASRLLDAVGGFAAQLQQLGAIGTVGAGLRRPGGRSPGQQDDRDQDSVGKQTKQEPCHFFGRWA